MGIDDELVWRHPFPGPGIAIRVLGEVTREQVQIARLADAIYIEEIKKHGLYREISQGKNEGEKRWGVGIWLKNNLFITPHYYQFLDSLSLCLSVSPHIFY